MRKIIQSSTQHRVGKRYVMGAFGGKVHAWEREANYALAIALFEALFTRFHFSKVEKNRVMRDVYRCYKPPLSLFGAENNRRKQR